MAPAYGQILNLTQSIIAYRSCLTVEIILTSGFQLRGRNHFLDCAGESSRIIYLAKFHVKLQSTETRH